MLKIIFRTAWEMYIKHVGGLLVSTILMFIFYLVLLKLTILGGELLKPFFLYGMFYVLLNYNEMEFPEVIVKSSEDEVEEFVKNVRHRPGRIEFSHFLKGFSDRNIAFKLICYGFLKTVFLAAGLVLLVVPGLYFEFATVFALPLIVKRNEIGVIESFKESIQIFNKYFAETILIILILILINGLAAFPYGFFSIFTVPFSICVVASAYEVFEREG